MLWLTALQPKTSRFGCQYTNTCTEYSGDVTVSVQCVKVPMHFSSTNPLTLHYFTLIPIQVTQKVGNALRSSLWSRIRSVYGPILDSESARFRLTLVQFFFYSLEKTLESRAKKDWIKRDERSAAVASRRALDPSGSDVQYLRDCSL
ncbi:hypothetical protein EVAR_696_1 [Eumeta japonica]|uniref:Uncharacterized protein n=1 Tax=Eumeta variegata TaxID=151549 RepID=A0A4C1SDT9_EUMVA|nr:hypothetical protein EVAR_696_1 [Eumeta japonica]